MDRFIASLVGKPYKANDYSGKAFDCYSLIYYIYKHYNIELPKHIVKHDLRVLNKKVKQDLVLWCPVEYRNRQFLDVLLFNTAKRLRTHVGLTINKRLFIHALDDEAVVLGHFYSNPYIAKLHKVYRWHTLLN